MNKEFLKDVFICSLSAFGGPEAHYGVFTRQLVEKKGYLSADELLEWMALTSFLPGPSSTQTITAIGYQKGGVKLALLTLLIWALPVVVFLTGLTFLIARFETFTFVTSIVAALGVMAIGFIFYAGFKLSKKVWVSKLTFFIWGLSLVITYFVRNFYVFPLVLLASGILHAYLRPSNQHSSKKIQVSWPYLLLVMALLLFGLMHPLLGFSRFLQMISLFTSYGSLVIGGGNVVIPYMYQTLVIDYGWLSSPLFLSGLGLVQGLPGPMFSFSAWAAGLSFQNGPAIIQLSAALIGAASLFLPGTLFIFLVAPMWPSLKENRFIKPALKGILAAAAGLVVSTAFTFLIAMDFNISSGIILGFTVGLLSLKKVPVPWIVMGVIVIGFMTL